MSSSDERAARTAPGRRARQAEQTRRDILDAARRRFGVQGYAGTSLREIAADAGVSVQTVYDSVGRKSELLNGLNDVMGEEAAVGEIARTIPVETDPLILAALPAQITRRFLERCGDIVRTSYLASRADPGLGLIAAEGGRRHRDGARTVAERLHTLGALRPLMTVEDAGTTIAMLSDARVGLVLLDDVGMGLDAVERWMAETTRRAVLSVERDAPATRS